MGMPLRAHGTSTSASIVTSWKRWVEKITAGRTAPFGTGRTHLSREDREDIVQRVLRGEEIRL